ncbi:pantetheine-phosphate adenylyltransferase [Thermospira aquatica]|uniref:Phosphopantetheine adenylyltransferase n=1 Tax=Thermospira aquatica TaxID=2828656 RepID=A0AAX3BDZ4_9SPIR|nr:pantetheine-phosphate adenylyltransferase [Thermospira aquatica]URA10455.1 pantetheine-phosphate adenylyltransferase [Thermospira aquatica]
MRLAVYPGSFDPFTNGHLDIALRAANIFDHVIIAVLHNQSKQPLFTVEERLSMIREIFEKDPRFSVDSFSGLLAHYVKKKQANAIIRGLRAVSDFEFEIQVASMNAHLCPEVETVFLMASEDNLFVSSSIIKEIALLEGDISDKVPAPVWRELCRKRNT